LDVAKQYNCPTADVFHAMLALQTSMKAADVKFSFNHDGVHPDPAGHLVMAHTMLQGFGAEPMPALGDFDLAAGTGNNLRLLTNDHGIISLETTAPAPTPFWFDPASLLVMRASGFLDMAGQKLTVRGLPAATYDVAVNGVRIAGYSAKELTDGIVIAGTYSPRGKQLHDAIAWKGNNYFSAWREIQVCHLYLGWATDLPQADKVYQAMMQVDDAISASVQQLCSPTDTTKITLTPVPDAH
jgi:hypothetical protein